MTIDKLIKKAKSTGEKIKRDAFLYFNSTNKQFAQCKTCSLWTAAGACAAMSGKKVPAEASCGVYLPLGSRVKTDVSDLTPEEVGYVERPVRCENCKFGGKECSLYKMLNEALPDVFDLDVKIEAHGCCNANTPADA